MQSKYKFAMDILSYHGPNAPQATAEFPSSVHSGHPEGSVVEPAERTVCLVGETTDMGWRRVGCQRMEG